MSSSRRWRIARWLIGPLLLAGVFFAWLYLTRPQPGEWTPVPRGERRGTNGVAPAAAPPPWLQRATPGGDLRDADIGDLSDPAAQLALWKKRLARSEQVLEAYRRTTRYPHESRPAREHDDQMSPNAPIVEDRRLKRPGEPPSRRVTLRTSQERLFVVGAESVLFTLAASDAEGNALPIAIQSAFVFDPPQAGKASARPRVAAAFATAADGQLAWRFTPSKQGFTGYGGQLRLEINLDVEGESGFVYFDLYVTPEPPALWLGSVRDAVEDGSLSVYLKADVKRAGRYVVTGRFDDGLAAPFSLAVFNGELREGVQEIRLPVFGRLIVEEAPAFPLRLRDVDGFLLLEDQFPDRALMPRLVGLVHQTAKYAPSAFSSAEWSSEERARYLAEYQRDVDLARRRIEELTRIAGRPGK